MARTITTKIIELEPHDIDAILMEHFGAPEGAFVRYSVEGDNTLLGAEIRWPPQAKDLDAQSAQEPA